MRTDSDRHRLEDCAQAVQFLEKSGTKVSTAQTFEPSKTTLSGPTKPAVTVVTVHAGRIETTMDTDDGALKFAFTVGHRT